MPQIVQVGEEEIEFPDSMGDDEIQSVLQKQFAPPPQPVAAPPEPRGTLQRAMEMGVSPYSEVMAPINLSAAEMTSGNEPISRIPRIGQQEGIVKQVGAGVVNAAAGAVESLATPMNIQLAPVAAVPGLGRILAGIFGVEMARNIPAQLEQAVEAPTVQGKVEGGLSTAITALFAGIGLKAGSGIKGRVSLKEKLGPVLGQEPVAAAAPETAIPALVRPVDELLSTEQPKPAEVIDATQERPITEGSQLERQDVAPRRETTEAGGSDRPLESGQVQEGAVAGAAPEVIHETGAKYTVRGTRADGSERRTWTQTKTGQRVGDTFDAGMALKVVSSEQTHTKGMPDEYVVREVAEVLSPTEVVTRSRDMTPAEIAAKKKKLAQENEVRAELGLEPVPIPEALEIKPKNEPTGTYPSAGQIASDAQKWTDNNFRRSATNRDPIPQSATSITPGTVVSSIAYDINRDGSRVIIQGEPQIGPNGAIEYPASFEATGRTGTIEAHNITDVLERPTVAKPNEPTGTLPPPEVIRAGEGEVLGARNEPAAPLAESAELARPESAAVDAAAPERLNETTPQVQTTPETALKAPRQEAPQTQAEPLSPGPGAASVAEPLASYEQRRFGQRFQESQDIAPEIREETGNRYYEPIPNKVTVADAESIIEVRGTDESIRLVRDEDFPMPPRVRVTVGQALIKKLNQSYQEASKAGDSPRAQEFLNQAVDTAEYLSEVGTTLGQGVQAFAIWSRLTPEGMLAEATRIARKSGTDLTPEQAKKIADLGAEIEKAPEGFQRNEKTMELMNYMAELKGVDPAEVPTALWYSNILSGFSTQLVNTLDTGLNVFSESVAMAASHPTAIPDIVTGLYQGMVKGGFEAANVLKTGRSVTGDKVLQQRVLERVKFGTEGGVPITTATPIGRFLKAAFESKVATPLNLWKYPLRAMVASDTVFYNSFKEARARVLARALAKKEGLSGDALFQRVDQVLNQSTGRYDAALKQAQAEGLEGINLRRRTREIIEQGRSDELVGAAEEAAQIATYNHEPSGVLGLVAHNIANITESFKPAKAIVPFTRIIANVANRGLDYTPYGFKRLFFGQWGGKKFGSEPPTGEAYRTQLVKATLGTTAMTAIAVLDANDTIQVTAQGPTDPDERKQLSNTGWKPYSVKVGDTFVSYQYTPLNLGFAMIGHYRDAIRYNKLSEKDAQTRLAYGMLKSGTTIFDMSFLSGVSDFIETVQGTTSSTKGAGRLVSRTASSVVIPNLVKQTDKLFDPTVYQADTIQEALMRETPIVRSLTMKPMLNMLGEPIRPSQNRFFTFEKGDPVWKLIVEKQAWIPVPSKTTKIQDRPITPEEYYSLIEQSGPPIRQHILDNLDRYQTMDAGEVQDEIRKESERVRKEIKSQF